MRELEITQHIFDDSKTEYIAVALGISVHTVNSYLQRIYLKLEVRSRSQLVLRILKTHLDNLTAVKSGRTANNVASINDRRISDRRISGL